jgi:hypothetical protein
MHVKYYITIPSRIYRSAGPSGGINVGYLTIKILVGLDTSYSWVHPSLVSNEKEERKDGKMKMYAYLCLRIQAPRHLQ